MVRSRNDIQAMESVNVPAREGGNGYRDRGHGRILRNINTKGI